MANTNGKPPKPRRSRSQTEPPSSLPSGLVAVYGLKNKETGQFDYIGASARWPQRLNEHFNHRISQFFGQRDNYTVEVFATVPHSQRCRVEQRFIHRFSRKGQAKRNGHNRNAEVYGVLNLRTNKFDFIGCTVDLPKHSKYQLRIWRTVYHRPTDHYIVVPIGTAAAGEAESLAVSLVTQFARHRECRFNRGVQHYSSAFAR